VPIPDFVVEGAGAHGTVLNRSATLGGC
jgi:hypothetical protein